MCVAPLGILGLLIDFVFRFLNQGDVPNFGADPNAPGFKEGVIIGQVLGGLFDLIGIGVQAFVLFGAYKMMKLESLTIAKAACIVSVIPCLSACCVLGIPFGIWGLVVLNDRGVSSHFQ